MKTANQEVQNARHYGTMLNYCNINNCTLWFYNGKYYMISDKTGYHIIPQDNPNNHGFMDYESTSNRIKLHWKGFIQNQDRA